MKPIMTRTIRAMTRLIIVGESVDEESLMSKAFPWEMIVLIESIAIYSWLLDQNAVALIDRRLNITFLLVHVPILLGIEGAVGSR